MIYEIWDRDSGNRLGEFSTPQDALRMVSRLAAGSSAKAIKGLVFGRENEGQTTLILEGQALVDSALKQERGETSARPARKLRVRLAAKKPRKKRR